MVDAHECRFQEVEIGEDDENGILKQGMLVLLPCVCGETPLDAMSVYELHLADLQKGTARLIVDRGMWLYHWSPTVHRKQIIRYGLRPSMRATTHSRDFVATYVCLADSPNWAWALSGGQRSAPAGSWDLWATSADRLTEPEVLARDDDNGLHEVRTAHRIYKRDLWFVGTRIKPATEGEQ